MKLKQNPSMNLDGDDRLGAGIEALRSESVDSSGMQFAINKMLSTSRKQSSSHTTFRYLTLGGVTAGISMLAFWPRPLEAASLKEILTAVKQQTSRYERVLKPDASGKLVLSFEEWAAPGKYASRWQADASERRYNGTVCYSYNPATREQSIEQSKSMEIDPVGIEYEAQFKVQRIEKEGSKLRYVFKMAPARQDLVVDAQSKLPIERDVYKRDGSVMEVHEYHFQSNLDPTIFEPQVRSGVTMHNYPEERAQVREILAARPQTQNVAGTQITLRAVIVDDLNGLVAAVVSGGDPRSPVLSRPAESSPHLQIVGIPGGFPSITSGEYTTLAGQAPGIQNTLQVNGEPARVEETFYPYKPTISDQCVIRVPVWKRDPTLPLVYWKTGTRIGTDSRLVGWVEFKVKHPFRTGSITAVLPNYVLPTSDGRDCPVQTSGATSP